jgi:hypothetical protein
MKELRRTAVLVFLMGLLIGLYTTFVLENLWNWFAAEALHLPAMSFWVMFALVLMIGMLRPDVGDPGQEYSLKALATAIEACVPEDKKEWVAEQFEDQQRALWVDIGWKVFSRILGATCTLLIGWAVHSFLL